ncbi:MAG TPA: hypothetical protein VFE25_16145, partial [Opitutaceae bacterium]|nr:hypothetical protein [Opitutaceae bacterium]
MTEFHFTSRGPVSRLLAGLGALGLSAGISMALPAGPMALLSGPQTSVPPDARSATAALPAPTAASWVDQNPEEAHRKGAGCIECHTGTEEMHASPHVVLGCTDCHG